MTTDTIGGVWTYCVDLCAALAVHRCSIALATMGNPLSSEQRRQVARMPHVKLYEGNYRLCWMPDSERDLNAAGEWLLALEEEIEPDLVHLNDLGHGNLPWTAPVMLVAHSCVYSWWQAVKGEYPPPEWQRYFHRVRAGVQRAEVVVAPTRAMLKSFTQIYGESRHSAVISNGRGSFAANDHKTFVVNDDGAPIVFASGRLWDEAKNIKALAAIAKDISAKAFVAGEQQGPDGSRGETASLECLGFLNDVEMASWLQRADIFAAPAFYEPFGLGILEAARGGCALVLGDIPSLREVWRDSALYVDPAQPEQLRDTLQHLLDDESLRQRMSRRAWQRSRIYTLSRMGRDYAHCYRWLLNRAATQPFGSLVFSEESQARQGA